VGSSPHECGFQYLKVGSSPHECSFYANKVDSSPHKCGLSTDKVDLPLPKITFDRNFIYFFLGLCVTLMC